MQSARIYVRLALRYRLLWLLVLAIGSTGLLLFLTHVPPDITREKYDKISQGMTEEQVEAIIGAPPGGYETCWCSGSQQRQQWSEEEQYHRAWVTREGWIEVGFTADGRACGKRFYNYVYREESRKPRKVTVWTWLFQRARPTRDSRIYSPF